MILLKFATEIKGDSSVTGHENWITLDSVQMGVGRNISSSGGGKSRDTSSPSFTEVNCGKSTDMSSSDLFIQAVSGKSLGDAEIHWIQTAGVDSEGQTYLIMKLQESIISNYSLSSGGERPNESFAINFTKITYHYDDYSGDKVTTGRDQNWDLMANKKF